MNNLTTPTGYLHPMYAEALSEFGESALLAKCRGWVLQRSIPGYTAVDAMGCYPLFSCENWNALNADLEAIDRKWVCLSLVTDPFGDYSPDYLRLCFPDLMVPFKQHFVVDLSQPPHNFVSDHHARNVRKALAQVAVEPIPDPLLCLDEWLGLYEVLVHRHQIHGLTTFSRLSFTKQLQVPGLVAFRALSASKTIGMLLWYVMGDIAYYHLGAYSDLGYTLRASFALFSMALDYFAGQGLKWLNLGAGAGTQGTNEDGLSRFKQGWSNSVRTAYFCGRVFDPVKYQQIVENRTGLTPTGYFPLYRQGEF